MVDRSEAADTWWGDKDYPPSIVLGIGKDVPSSIFGVTSGLAFAIGVYCVAQVGPSLPHPLPLPLRFPTAIAPGSRTSSTSSPAPPSTASTSPARLRFSCSSSADSLP